ncbi:MAG: potassium-transporting ATPase subunit KdpC [Planctomycetota bacterium]|nr:potassium-transporting ATPase subunit KdpC [Planctomycetota bacterium]
MVDSLRPAASLLVLFTLLLGLAYPLAVTGAARAVLPGPARGSVVENSGGEALGSRLIGQSFTDPKYFWGRLSATPSRPYNAAFSGGSNYGPLNSALVDAARARIEALRAAERAVAAPEAPGPVPQDLVTSSGSGLDPHISPAAAEFQVARVARARGLSEDDVRAAVRRHTSGRQFGILGEPRVNVLLLNLDLDGVRFAGDADVAN